MITDWPTELSVIVSHSENEKNAAEDTYEIDEKVCPVLEGVQISLPARVCARVCTRVRVRVREYK